MRFSLIIFLFLLTVGLFGQDRPSGNHHRARIYYETAEQLSRLDHLGVAVDHGKHKIGYSLESDFSEAELAIVEAEGLRYEIVIKNVGQYYLDQNNPASPSYIAPATAPQTTAGNSVAKMNGCDANDSGPDYDTPLNYNNGSMGGFLTYEEMLQELDDMYAYSQENNLGIITPRADNINPDLPDDLRTAEGRYQQWVLISNNAESNTTGQPQVFYNAIHHAREPASLQQLIFFMWYLLENYATDPEVKDIVDNTELFFMPCVNPDGYLYNEATDPDGGGFWRKNRRDGHGVDNNRNYDYITPEGNSIFGTTGVSTSVNGETYPGTEPFSEPENRGTRYFTETHNFTITLNNHTSGGLLLYPYGYEVGVRTPDDAIFRAISAEMVSENGYGDILSSQLYAASGDSDDFGYGFLQTTDGGTRERVFSMTPEIGPSFWPAENQIEGICKDMVLHNMRAAQFTGVYGKVTDETPELVETIEFIFDYSVLRLGFIQGDLTVGVEPVSDNITSFEAARTYGSLVQGIAEADDMEITLDPAISTGDLIEFDVVIGNGRREVRQRISKRFGQPTTILTESVENLDRWTPGEWGLSTAVFHPSSPAASITDSPDGQYENGRNDFIEFNELLDLTENNLIDARLTFFALWEIEADYDWVQVQVAREGTNFWEPLCGRYTNTGVQDQIGADGEPVYDGLQASWVAEEMSLNDYLGERMKLRLYIFSDQGVTADGFYFDQLELKTLRNIPVSTRPTALDERLDIYPNPVAGELTIASDLAGYDLVLRDALGRTLRTVRNLRGTERLSLSDLIPGIYLVTIRADGAEKTVRVVKE